MFKTFVLLASFFVMAACFAASDLVLWQDAPGKNWESDYFPLGNGSLGAMLNGGVENAEIQLNLDSLWTGDSDPIGDNFDRPDANYNDMGNYQPLGSIFVTFDGMESVPVKAYRRSLDLETAVHAVEFTTDRGSQSRKAFISAVDGVLAYRIRSEFPLSGRITLRDSREGLRFNDGGELRTIGTDYTAETIILRGVLPNALRNQDALSHFRDRTFEVKPNDLRYEARAKVFGDGKITGGKDGIRFTGCRELTLLLAGDTTYCMDNSRHFYDASKLKNPEKRLANLDKVSFDTMEARHIADYKKFFDRVSLRLGGGKNSALPLAARIQACRNGEKDPALAALLFQYGRYLLISSSRPGTLPANLQGIWNNSITPAWHCDYHTNINIQMNYWGVEAANLSELHMPLFDLFTAAIPAAAADTRRVRQDRPLDGFTFRTSMNIFGGPGWRWNWPSGAWLAQHFYRHWQYSGDREFLSNTAWPFFDGVMKFWLGYLKHRDDGTWVVPNGWSPEHGPTVDGVAHDQQIAAEFFDEYLDAARELGIENDRTKQAAEIRPHLLGNKIGKWGQLQEWEEDLDKKGDDHRHTSHLFAVYPGSTIDAVRTPKLFRAAKVSLEGRAMTGDAHRSWTWPWRAALWARLGDGSKSVEMIDNLLRYNTMNNLFTTHPPFQIDGNLGVVGAICEMFLQSDSAGLFLLPIELPAWPDGSFSGLRAPGGYTVSAEWKDNVLLHAEITADRTGTLNLRTRTPVSFENRTAQSFQIPLKAGQTVHLKK